MIPGIYSAATAMDNAGLRHELVARNLANMNVPGFRRMTVSQQTFESTMGAQSATRDHDSLGAAVGSPMIDHTQGGYKQTDRPLDFALDGDGEEGRDPAQLDALDGALDASLDAALDARVQGCQSSRFPPLL